MLRKAFFGLIVLVSIVSAERFVHSTEKVSLRVDDNYPAGFVEFRLNTYGFADLLWRSFLAIEVPSGAGRALYHGIAADAGDLFATTFMRADSLVIFEELDIDTQITIDSILSPTDTIYDTLIDTTVISRESYCSFRSNDNRIELKQKVFSGNDFEPFIEVTWIISNISTSGNIDGAKCAFHFDGDVPDGGWDDDFALGLSDILAACQKESSTGNVVAGFAWLSGGYNHRLYNTENYFDNVATRDALFSLVDGNFWTGSEHCPDSIDCPVWVNSLYGDIGIGILFDLPSLAPSNAETLRFMLIAADSFALFESVARLFGLSEICEKPEFLPKHTSILAVPNPFNSTCVLHVKDCAFVDIFDITGKCIVQLPVTASHATFYADDLPSGIYFARPRAAKATTTKLFLLR